MMLNELNSAISRFSDNARKYWKEIESGNSKAANKAEKSNATIVNEWRKKGVAIDVLLRLTSHADIAVKFAAAAYLISFEKNDIAASVLRDIEVGKHGLMSASASVILRANGE
ncbi:hypothetical protein [Ralstonia solanacearum]|uniref:hypothetical protein n=1 Tax=Ralstonia solanacearum TaxID=305 RepID=UPI000AA4500E|nr:hypothetical protein [Ralstonia solanacearum]QHB56063.1 hypothetical protein GRB31_13875 [Ralstonia solanacearum]